MSKREEWRGITRQLLARLYHDHTMPEIAATYGVTTGAVAYRLRFFGLTARDTGFKHSPGPKRGFNPPKKELARLYKRMSMRDVAAHYGVSETVIHTRLHQCGIPIVSRSKRLTGKPKTLEHRLAMSIGKRGLQAGKKNPNWKGGISSLNKRARSKAAYFDWKNAVLKRAGHKCQSCGIEHGSICRHCGHRVMLHAHHIKDFASSEKLRYNTRNGRALCDRCHRAAHDPVNG